VTSICDSEDYAPDAFRDNFSVSEFRDMSFYSTP
jgi:hypothetical protein